MNLLSVDVGGIPQSLKNISEWAPWQGSPRKGKPGKVDKVPQRVDAPGAGASTRESWWEFDQAIEAMHAGKLAGMGLNIKPEANITGFDMDGCARIEPSGTVTIEPWAAELVSKAKSYAEVSPSGTGIRLFFTGRCDDWTNNEQGIEVYAGNAARFVTVTGQQIEGTPATVNAPPAGFLAEIEGKYRKAPKPERVSLPMPRVLEDGDLLTVPEIPEAEARFLQSGDIDGVDRSAFLARVARSLYSALPGSDRDSLVLSILAANEHAMRIALDHRGGRREKALAYLWEWHCIPARSAGLSTESDFAEKSEQPEAPAVTVDAAPEKKTAAQAVAGAFPRVKRLSEVTIHAGNGNFIDGLCNRGETFQTIGAPGGRKSQGIGWMAYCVATGQRWFNRETASGSVLYIAAERESEQAKRFTVWALADGRDLDALPLRLMGPGSSLARLDFARYVAEQAAALNAETGQPCRLIVIDTTMSSLPGLDLNKTETATQFGQSLRVIAGKVPSAAVCAVHHTPKSGAETGMGSQGFDACFEATLLIEATEAGASVKQIKGNTTRDWIEPFHWTGEAVQAEHRGEIFLAWRPAGTAAPQAAVRRAWKEESATGRAFTVLCDLSPQNVPVAEAAWKEACQECFGTGDKLHKQFFDAKKRLRRHGAIVPAGEGSWCRRCE